MRGLVATLPVLDLALGAVEAVRAAARRAGAEGPVVDAPLDPARVAASFASDRLLRLDGEAWVPFGPHSGFFRTCDGWVRTHANYPHHRVRLLRSLDLPDAAGRTEIAARLAASSAQAVEDSACAEGAVAVRVRTEAEWRASPAGRAAALGPLVRIEPRTDGRADRPVRIGSGEQPLAGIQVLDLTRVVAGPVATRTLALLGADVLRVDPPEPAEIGVQHLDTGQGKRTVVLDLRDSDDRHVAQRLLDAADVLVTGYRPGAIERLGLRRPEGIVRARVSAWGQGGPWAARRGFDSIVQAACGIALVESADGVTPGALPAQALDHATGYLLAAGVVDALTAVARDGVGRDVVASLARTATWLLDAPGRDPYHRTPATPSGSLTVTHDGVTTARPALPVDDYPSPAHPWGSDEPGWG
ncbi:CoA transferase [Isoptericola jiangsuensis]|uniref:CoA transferase n=1 Tax=Isoptericola jiangsuensis TaxID=548579 RepID=UPI003AABDD07